MHPQPFITALLSVLFLEASILIFRRLTGDSAGQGTRQGWRGAPSLVRSGEGEKLTEQQKRMPQRPSRTRAQVTPWDSALPNGGDSRLYGVLPQRPHLRVCMGPHTHTLLQVPLLIYPPVSCDPCSWEHRRLLLTLDDSPALGFRTYVSSSLAQG